MNWLTGSKLGDARKLVNQLKDSSKRERATADLLRLGAEAAPALIEALQTQDQNLLPLYQQVLARMGVAATPVLTHSLLNDHPLIRGRVAEVLAQTKDPKAVPALLEALRGEYYTVRGRAARALGATGDKQAIQPLLEALSDSELEVRVGALIGLGYFKEPDTFDRMADLLLEDTEIEARQAAAKALGGTKHPQAHPVPDGRLERSLLVVRARARSRSAAQGHRKHGDTGGRHAAGSPARTVK